MDGGLGGFLLWEFSTSRTSPRLHESESTIEFYQQHHLFGDKKSPSRVLIRSCYQELALETKHLLFHGNTDVFIAGTRGIGKSAFGMLMALDLADEGFAVLYEHKGEYFLLLGRALKDRLLEVVNRSLASSGFDSVSSPGLFCFPASARDVFDALSRLDAMVHVQDLGDNELARVQRSGTSKKLILSSPNNKQLEKLNNNTSVKLKYMPLWSWDELELARGHCFPHIPNADALRRFNRYGGVPRTVLEFSDQRNEEILYNQIRAMSTAELINIMTKASYFDLPSQSNTNMLVHVLPDPKYGFRCEFASEEIGRLLAETFVVEDEFSFEGFVVKASAMPQFAGWRGYMLEALAHRVLSGHEPIDVGLFLLSSTIPVAVFSKPQPLFFSESFLFRTVDDIQILKPDVYYMPIRKNEKTIDAFALATPAFLKKHFNVVSTDKFTLVFFQVTVSEHHVADGTTLNHHRDWMKKTLGVASLSTMLVFVTSKTKGIIHAQQVTRINDDPKIKRKRVAFVDQKQFGPQFVMHIGSKFEQVMDRWRVPKQEVEEEEV